MEKSRSTRKNHNGGFTTTVILTDSTARIYGRGRTREDANASADRKLENYLAVRPADRTFRLLPSFIVERNAQGKSS